MTGQVIDFSQIDLTGKVQWGSENIGAVHFNGERLWPFGVDLLYTGGIGGASYLPDPADVYGASALAAFGEGVSAVLDEKNGTPVLGPELAPVSSFVFNNTSGGGGTVTDNSNVQPGVYRVTFTVSDWVAGGLLFRLRTTSGTVLASLQTPNASGNREYSAIFATTAAAQRIELISPGGAASPTTCVVTGYSLRSVSGIPALQPSASLRPLIGRAPRVRSNLVPDSLLYSLNKAQSLGFRSPTGVSVASSPSETVATTQGEMPFFAMTEDTSTGFHWVVYGANSSLTGAVPWPGDPTVLEWIVKKSGRRYAVIRQYSSTPFVQAVFDLNTGTVASSTFQSAECIALGGDVFILRVSNGFIGGGNQNYRLGVADDAQNVSYTGDGREALLVSNVHVQAGTFVPRHQINRSGNLDVTEAGAPAYPFIRFDLSDDRLDTVLPEAVTGDVVIAGRNGSVIAPHSYAANTTFQLGPTSYTGGTPGILRAIGDVVGWSIFGKTLTDAERERLMRFYKRRGAKGLLVPGPELVVNGRFDAGIAGWTDASDAGGAIAYDAAAQALSIVFSSGVAIARQNISGSANSSCLVQFDVVSITGAAGNIAVQIGSTVGGSQLLNATQTGTGTFSQVVLFTAAPASIQFREPTAGTVVIDNVSVRELRPEEES